jgi:hypothetical protein
MQGQDPSHHGAPKCYSKEEARMIFRKSVSDGSILFRKHASARMKEYGLDNNDVLELSRSGLIFNEPEVSINTGDMLYRIESDKLKIKAQFICMSESKVRLITVMKD